MPKIVQRRGGRPEGSATVVCSTKPIVWKAWQGRIIFISRYVSGCEVSVTECCFLTRRSCCCSSAVQGRERGRSSRGPYPHVIRLIHQSTQRNAGCCSSCELPTSPSTRRATTEQSPPSQHVQPTSTDRPPPDNDQHLRTIPFIMASTTVRAMRR